MAQSTHFRLQLVVFALVSASFTNIYITQPVLPILQQEFGSTMVVASFSVSAVILGIALANLPFGYLVDRLPIRPLILTGGLAVACGGLICAATDSLWLLITARFFQGIFIPALTTCLAAYLAKTLPLERLNVVMGSYVSATVLGGLGGRLLGGWLHPPLHWRYAFISASCFILLATAAAYLDLPEKSTDRETDNTPIRYRELLSRWELVLIFCCAAGSFSIFSSIFNYLPYRLQGTPFNLSTELTTMVYFVYIVGIFIGPLSGKMCNRFGSGSTLIGGTLVLGLALLMLLLPSMAAIVAGLLGICAGFFTIHAAAVGSLNRKLTRGHGRANALYVLFYYAGGWSGITGAGIVYQLGGWQAVVFSALLVLTVPLSAGLCERRLASSVTLAENTAVTPDDRQSPTKKQ